MSNMLMPNIFGNWKKIGVSFALPFLVLCFAHIASADEASSISASSIVSSPGINADWTNPENASVSDDVYASVSGSSSEDPESTRSDALSAGDFGFSIPLEMVIEGIVVEVEKNASHAEGTNAVKDMSVKLKRAGTPGVLSAGDRGDSSTLWSLTDTVVSYGAPDDLWGEVWIPLDINDPGFGVAFFSKVEATGATVVANVDSFKITVHYSLPPPPPDPDPEPEPEPEPEQESTRSSGGSRRRTAVETEPAIIPIITESAEPAGQVLGLEIFLFTRDLKRGDRGEDVAELQRRLTSEGIYFGPVTGFFGPFTFAGVNNFQWKYGINQVGQVGPITRGKLNSLASLAQN